MDLTLASFKTYPYALINPLQLDEGAWSDLRSIAIVPDRYRSQSHLFPRLVELAQLDDAELNGLLDRAHDWWRDRATPYFSALLSSTVNSDGLRRHLVRQIDQYHLARRDYDVIRLHDPKVFRHLRWLLNASQWESLLGPIDAWAWLEPDGTWQVRERGRTAADPASRFGLSPEQWISMLRIGEINQCLTHLARIAPHIRDDAALAQHLDALLGEAWTMHRLEDRSDRMLYAEQAIRVHPRIHQHPELQRRLHQARSGESTYAGLCADLDDVAMLHLADEVKHPYKEHV